MPARRARAIQSRASPEVGQKGVAPAWYSAAGTSWQSGNTGDPPTSGHDSSQPCWLTCPQWMNIPKRAVSNQVDMRVDPLN